MDWANRYGVLYCPLINEANAFVRGELSEKEYHDFVFKHYVHLLANGVSVVMWHCHRWPYAYEVDQVAATGIVDYQGFAPWRCLPWRP